jgi:hypothetical protein
MIQKRTTVPDQCQTLFRGLAHRKSLPHKDLQRPVPQCHTFAGKVFFRKKNNTGNIKKFFPSSVWHSGIAPPKKKYFLKK